MAAQRNQIATIRLVLSFSLTALVACRPSVKLFSYYETLDYDPSELAAQHSRVTREADRGRGIQLHLHAYNRSFHSVLRHSKGVFGASVEIMVGGVTSNEYDRRTFYEGKLHDEEDSRVIGHILDGVFDGIIHSKHGQFHVERANKFFGSPQMFHSIIYRDIDVQTPENSPSTCGVKGALLERLKQLSSHAVPLSDDREALYGTDTSSRMKRNTINGNLFCPIRVAADHLFLANVGGGSIVNTMSDIVSVIASVQAIYRQTDFINSDGMSDNIQPVVVKLEILEQSMPGYRYGANNIGVNDFLDLWSQEDQNAYCLALLLTYRDFDGGVLGLAWVAQPPGGNRGGICEQRVRLSAGNRNLNTAIVTFLNYGQMQPRSVSTITIAHEFGHNFGSPHDPQGTCSPGGSSGNFIMFPQATDGSQPNNERFSSCSINSIRPVLEGKSNCFTATEAFCGNGIREAREDCDCGAMCAQDRCCRTNCTFTPGSVCSSMDPCCISSTCQLQDQGFTCLNVSECGEASVCSGTESTCPQPRPFANNVRCNNDRNVCVNGVCSGSICVARGHTDCQCSQSAGNADDQLCHICCRETASGPCRSSFDLYGQSIGEFRQSGRSCNNFAGYCSNSNPPSCQLIDNERTLNDLLDIFNIGTLNKIAMWLQVYWYVPVCVLVGIVILLILLRVTYRRRKPIKRRLSEMRRNSTLRRRPNQNVSAAQTGGVGGSGNQGRGRGGGGRGGRQGQRERNREISQNEGEQRLRQFFPTIDRETMVAIMRSTRSESKAVKRILDLGFPLKKVPLPQQRP